MQPEPWPKQLPDATAERIQARDDGEGGVTAEEGGAAAGQSRQRWPVRPSPQPSPARGRRGRNAPRRSMSPRLSNALRARKRTNQPGSLSPSAPAGKALARLRERVG